MTDAEATEVALVDELRRVNLHLATTEVDAGAASDLTVALQAFRERAGVPRKARWADRSPFHGRMNATGPPLRLRRDDAERCVIGEATLDDRFEGPPGAAHGGVVAGLLDEVLGVVPSAFLGTRAVTGRLTVRYRAPTPLGRPLRIRAWIASERGRRVVVRGECAVGSDITADAEGLFIGARS